MRRGDRGCAPPWKRRDGNVRAALEDRGAFALRVGARRDARDASDAAGAKSGWRVRAAARNASWRGYGIPGDQAGVSSAFAKGPLGT
jgi:hypothetical protein